MRLFLAGDVMLGRGIDQILPFPGNPQLHENYVRSALDYVRLAERANGPIPRGVGLDYVWSDAGSALATAKPHWGIVNLETAITDDGKPAPKGINYRMSVRNAQGLRGLGIDCCVLANNHVLDWGPEGLADTLDTLHALPMATAGAGRNAGEAAAPAILGGDRVSRLIVFGFACRDSGVPRSWAADDDGPGVNLLKGLDEAAVSAIKARVAAVKRAGDIAVASIHWGGNWGYDVPLSHRRFAHALIDDAGVDLVHGHSSHHVKGWELHNDKLILYGCGDLINDYEGISGQEEYRSDLSALYIAELDETSGGSLASLTLIPLVTRNFSLHRAAPDETRWLRDVLNRESRSPGRRFGLSAGGTLTLDTS